MGLFAASKRLAGFKAALGTLHLAREVAVLSALHFACTLSCRSPWCLLCVQRPGACAQAGPSGGSCGCVGSFGLSMLCTLSPGHHSMEPQVAADSDFTSWLCSQS